MTMEQTTGVNQVHIEITINAPIDRVFRAWTDPKKLMKWYAPDGCTILFKKLEIKTGGRFHSCISNPEYGDCWCIGEYREIISNSKLVFTMINADEYGNPVNPADVGMDKNWPMETLVTVTFTPDNGKTKLQLRQTVSEALAKKTGAHPSWLQMIDKMQRLLNEEQ